MLPGDRVQILSQSDTQVKFVERLSENRWTVGTTTPDMIFDLSSSPKKTPNIAIALQKRHSAYIGGSEAEWGIDLECLTRATAAKLIMLIMDRINDDRGETLFAIPSEDQWTEQGLRSLLGNANIELKETDDPLVLALSLIDEVRGTTPRLIETQEKAMPARVYVYIIATGAPSSPEDEDVPGAYLIEVDADLSNEGKASAALDCFHEHIGIDMVDDFSFEVRDGNGAELSEAEDAENNTMGDHALFCGSIDIEDVPLPSNPAP